MIAFLLHFASTIVSIGIAAGATLLMISEVRAARHKALAALRYRGTTADETSGGRFQRKQHP